MGWTNSGKKIETKVAVGDSGKAQILEILIDGAPIDFSTIESENPYTDEPMRPEPEPMIPPAEEV